MCSSCGPGSFAANQSSTRCLDCTSGRFQPHPGQADCLDCLVGTYTSASTTKYDCALCEKGSYQAFNRSTECVLCPTGTQQPLTGRSSCDACVTGKYAASSGTVDCVSCEKGKQQSLTGKTECFNCDNGRFKATSGPQECVLCAAGSYTSSSTTYIECALCGLGKIQPLAGQSECLACEVGRYMDNTGSNASACGSCESGKVASREGESICLECTSSVDFQHQPESGHCDACPLHAQAALNHTTCECSEGYYAIPFGDYELFITLDQDTYNAYHASFILPEIVPELNPSELLDMWCVRCPVGADCRFPGQVIANTSALDGYFIGLDGIGSTFYPCLNEHCLTDGNCTPGYTGLSCASCEEGLVLTDSYQ